MSIIYLKARASNQLLSNQPAPSPKGDGMACSAGASLALDLTSPRILEYELSNLVIIRH